MLVMLLFGNPGGPVVKRIRLPVQEMQEMRVWPLGLEDPLEREMAIQSSILAWKIPWAEEPEGLQFGGWQRGGCD